MNRIRTMRIYCHSIAFSPSETSVLKIRIGEVMHLYYALRLKIRVEVVKPFLINLTNMHYV